MVKLIRTKPELFASLNTMLNYYDSFMVKNNFDKITSREELFEMFHDYHNWLQGKK